MKNILTLTLIVWWLNSSVAMANDDIWSVSIDETGNALFGKHNPKGALTPAVGEKQCFKFKSPCTKPEEAGAADQDLHSPIQIKDWSLGVESFSSGPAVGGNTSVESWQLQFINSSNRKLLLTDLPDDWTASLTEATTLEESNEPNLTTALVNVSRPASGQVKIITPVVATKTCVISVPCEPDAQ